MKECDNSKIHICSNFPLSVCLLIMLDTFITRTITTLQHSETLWELLCNHTNQRMLVTSVNMVAKVNIGIFVFLVTKIQIVNMKSIMTLGKTTIGVTKFNSSNNRKFLTLVRKTTTVTLVNKIITNFLTPSSKAQLTLPD
jgi:hypothetical protein